MSANTTLNTAPSENGPYEGHGHLHGQDHTQAKAVGYVAAGLLALAILFPLFIWISVVTHG